MRVRVDVERCVGAGNCVLSSPEVFDQDEEAGTVVLLDPAPSSPAAVGGAQEAARLCPGQAITVEEEG